MSDKKDRSPTRSLTGSPDKANMVQRQLQQDITEFKKQNAILSQKIELLQIQLKDSQDREETTKRLHETMLSAFDENKSDIKIPNADEIHKLLANYSKQLLLAHQIVIIVNLFVILCIQIKITWIHLLSHNLT